MGALDKFLRRFGFVRLGQYGLVHTADDRVVSTRPTVLDDGLGTKIVGWRDGDLAAMELEPWLPAGVAAPKKPVAPKPLPAPQPAAARPLPGVAPLAVPAPAPAPVPAPVIVQAPAPAPKPVVAPAPTAAPPPQVAQEPVVEEDDWEWEIAVARARAEAADAERTAVAAPQPELLASLARTESESWDEPAPKPVARAPKVTQQPFAPVPARVQPSGRTIIPVPSLPVAADPRSVRPVVAPRRMPRATGRLEDTIQTRAAPPANEDRTSTQVTLPRAASTIGLPSSRRVAAKQR
ncbi:MAG: hypothetical protein ACM31C_03070 [Acidobacteriota bacterium]